MGQANAGAIKRFVVTASFLLLLAQESSTPVTFHSASASAGDYSLYSESLTSGWSNWSWGGWVNFSDANHYSGSSGINFTSQAAWSALYLHTDDGLDTHDTDSITFAAKATTAGQKFSVFFYDENNADLGSHQNLADYGGDPQTDNWKVYTIPLNKLGAADKTVKGLAIQDIGPTRATVYLDDIKLVSSNNSSQTSPSPTPSTPVQPAPVSTQALTTNTNDYTIYSDSLSPGWSNWSWNSQVQPDSTQNPFGGAKDIAYKSWGRWSGLYLHSGQEINTSKYANLNFAARASQTSQKFKLVIYDGNSEPIGVGVNFSDIGGDPTVGAWKTYNIPLDKLSAGNRTIKGLVIQDAGGISDTLYVDEIKLSSSASTTTPQASTGGFTTSAGSILKNGVKIALFGINWFGFETDTHVVHGLWARNYKDVISQFKNLGFNAFRLPFCPASVQGVNPTSIDYSKNPDLTGLNSLSVLDKIVNEMSNQGLFILLDSHRPDCSAQSDLWYTASYPESAWINDLKTLAGRYEGVSNFLGLDLKNEPHGAATWGTGNAATDWNLAAERAGREVLSVNPNILVFVEGVGDNPSCQDGNGHFWGGNLAPAKCTPIESSKIPTNKLVYAPHVYGPDVAYQNYFGDGNFPSNMPGIWDAQWGYLKNSGFAMSVGEWGGKYGNGGNLQDVTWQNSFVNYLKFRGICNSFYWDLNPNSGDTGGVLQDDWQTPWANKVNLLQGYFGGCTQ